VIPDGEDLAKPVQSFIDDQANAGGDFLREDAEGHFRDEFSTFDWVIEGMLVRAGFTILDHRVESHVILGAAMFSDSQRGLDRLSTLNSLCLSAFV